MRERFVRKPAFLIASTSVVMLVAGLIIGLALGSAGKPVQATGFRGYIDIANGSDLYSCVSAAYGCTPSPQVSNACHAEGNSDAIACDFQAAPHSGGAIQEDGIQCFNVTPAGILAADDSQIVYAPSGQVHIRCEFPEGGPSGIGSLAAPLT